MVNAQSEIFKFFLDPTLHQQTEVTSTAGWCCVVHVSRGSLVGKTRGSLHDKRINLGRITRKVPDGRPHQEFGVKFCKGILHCAKLPGRNGHTEGKQYSPGGIRNKVDLRLL